MPRSDRDPAPPPYPVGELDALPEDAFVARLAGVFEGSPWVARAAAAARPFGSRAALHAAMVAAVAAAPREARLRLIRAHPDLAGRAAVDGTLAEASAREQAGAGLDRLDPERYRRFHRRNDAYRERFGFPFVIAVRRAVEELRAREGAGASPADAILAAFDARLANDPAAEEARALDEIATIARYRLDDLVADGPGPPPSPAPSAAPGAAPDPQEETP